MSKTEVLTLKINSDIGDVAKETDKAAMSQTGLNEATKKYPPALKLAKKAQEGVTKATKGWGTAMKAAGIGLIISAFMALKEALSKNQKVMDMVEAITSTIAITFNQVADALVDVYDWVTASSDRFDGLTKVLKGVMTLALAPLKGAFYTLKLAVTELMLAWEDSFLGNGDQTKIDELRANVIQTRDDLDEVKQNLCCF